MKHVYTTFLLLALLPALAQQGPDPNFNAAVQSPAYTKRHPRVVIDEAHENFHTADGRYKPFAQLLRNDGYLVEPGKAKFDKKALRGMDVLVIANAAAPDASDTSSHPAFTEAECDAVREWVQKGGSLLLIADHTPFGEAAANLAKRFGVEMGGGFVFDYDNSVQNPTMLVFSRENGLLGTHAIIAGRNDAERVNRVVAFTGQSLTLPKDASVLMKLGAQAYEARSRKDMKAIADGGKGVIAQHAKSVAGGAQGLVMRFGKGRVAMFGEAAMFSAQVIKRDDQEFKMGMNVEGNDDRQLALNVLHWLTGLLK